MIRNPFTFFSKSSPPPINELPMPLDDHIEKVDSSFQLLRDATNQVAQAAIEASKNLEQRLIDIEYRFFSTIDAIEDFVIIKDGEGRWKTVNRAGQMLFKWIHGEYYDFTNEQLAEKYVIYSETLTKCSETDEVAWMSKKSSRSKECIPYGTEGYKWFDILKTPVFDEHGNRKDLITIGRDITEEIEKQRRMNAAFIALNSINDIIVILDFRAHIYFCNDAFLHQFGIDSYESVVGKHICNHLPIAKYDEGWEIISSNREWTCDCMDESLEMHITPMMNGVSYPIYYICSIRKKK